MLISRSQNRQSYKKIGKPRYTLLYSHYSLVLMGKCSVLSLVLWLMERIGLISYPIINGFKIIT